MKHGERDRAASGSGPPSREAGGRGDSERGGRLARRLGLILGPALFLLLLFLPGLPLDAMQRRVAAVSALTATFWITVAIPIGAASLIPAALLPLLGVMTAREVAPTYMPNLVFLFVGAFIVALGLERWEVHRRMALWIIARVGTSPRSLVLGFMVAAAFLSMWINNTATTLLMLPIGLAVVARVGEDQETEGGRRRFAQCLLLGIAYSASVGGMGTPVGTAPNQEFLGQFERRFPEGPQIAFGDWFIAWFPLVVLFVPVAWFLMTRLLLPVRGGSRVGGQAIAEERRRQGPLSRGQLLMGGVFASTALLWLTRADLDLGLVRIPGWSRIFLGSEAATAAGYAAHKNDISDSTVALGMAILCFLIPVDRKAGVYLMDWRTAVRMPWEVLLLLGGGFCIAGAFRVSGLDQVLGEIIGPWLAGHSTWIVVLGVVASLSLLTELTSNTATTAVLLPVMAQAAVEGGVNPLMVMAPTAVAASAAFMLPVATPPNAVVFASRSIPPPVMARVGFWLNITAVLLITLVFQLWVRRIWGISPELPAWAGG